MLDAAKLELDDRREIWRMLQRLDGRQRVVFVGWCCRQVSGPDGLAGVRVTSHTGTAMEAYYDVMMLCFAFKLDLSRAAEQLVRICKRL